MLEQVLGEDGKFQAELACSPTKGGGELELQLGVYPEEGKKLSMTGAVRAIYTKGQPFDLGDLLERTEFNNVKQVDMAAYFRTIHWASITQRMLAPDLRKELGPVLDEYLLKTDPQLQRSANVPAAEAEYAALIKWAGLEPDENATPLHKAFLASLIRLAIAEVSKIQTEPADAGTLAEREALSGVKAGSLDEAAQAFSAAGAAARSADVPICPYAYPAVAIGSDAGGTRTVCRPVYSDTRGEEIIRRVVTAPYTQTLSRFAAQPVSILPSGAAVKAAFDLALSKAAPESAPVESLGTVGGLVQIQAQLRQEVGLRRAFAGQRLGMSDLLASIAPDPLVARSFDLTDAEFQAVASVPPLASSLELLKALGEMKIEVETSSGNVEFLLPLGSGNTGKVIAACNAIL